MPTQIATPSHSSRQLPPVHAVMLEFDLLSTRWLADGRGSLQARVRRATETAIIALEAASFGHRRKHHLRRAHEAIVVCQSAYRIFLARGELDGRNYDAARRRTDQILAGLEALIESDDKDLGSVELPPIEVPSNEQEVSEVVVAVHRLIQRVDLIAPRHEDRRHKNGIDPLAPDEPRSEE